MTNIIENYWEFAETFDGRQFANINEKCIEKEWEELSQKIIKKLYKSLSQRMAAVVKRFKEALKYYQTRFFCFYPLFFAKCAVIIFSREILPHFYLFFNNTKYIAKSLIYVTYTC